MTVTAYLIKPELFKGRYINVMIETVEIVGADRCSSMARNPARHFMVLLPVDGLPF